MMKLEFLQKEKINAMKNKDIVRKKVLVEMIDAIQKASITAKGRIEITDKLVDETLIKYQKTVQEMIDTCPENRIDKLEEYNANMAIVKEYAPQLITDEAEILNMIESIVENSNLTLVKGNRGEFMKYLKGKVDLKIANSILGGMLH